MLLYNGRLIPEDEIKLPVTNRAFQFNDGFFETVMVVNNQLRFWHDHVARMRVAAQALMLDLPIYFREPIFEQQLLQLAELNNALKYGRLKLKVWRAGEGLYTPETNEIEWMATVKPVAFVPSTAKINIGITQRIKTICSPLSHFKGPNALIYVLAGAEKNKTGYDDMLLLNPQGKVSELISSNIFWLMENHLFTPALDTGCVSGIARRNILKWCKQKGIKTHEAYFSPKRLFDAEAVFSANVTGLKSINSIEGSKLNLNERFVQQIHHELGFSN